MNIRQTLAQLANEMDMLGMHDEANSLDNVLQSLPNATWNVTPENILKMSDAAEIINDARNWVEDCQWDDQDSIESYDDLTILKGLEKNYEGGLAQFLNDRVPTDK